MKRSSVVFSLFLLSFFILTTTIYAHPGNTAGDGCHYCRTNCDSWGVAWNQRHCHNDYSPPPVIYYDPTPTPTLTPTPTISPTPTITPTQKPTEVLGSQTKEQKTEQPPKTNRSLLQIIWSWFVN